MRVSGIYAIVPRVSAIVPPISAIVFARPRAEITGKPQNTIQIFRNHTKVPNVPEFPPRSPESPSKSSEITRKCQMHLTSHRDPPNLETRPQTEANQLRKCRSSPPEQSWRQLEDARCIFRPRKLQRCCSYVTLPRSILG